MKYFDTFSEAFDYCREINKPVIVTINDQIYKLYPSGKCVPLEPIIGRT